MELKPSFEEVLNGSYTSNLSDEDLLRHYGVKRRSGRYPWGSGDTPFQRSGDFLDRVDELKKRGVSETDIAKGLGLSTTRLRDYRRIALHERKQLVYDHVKSLSDDGFTPTEIARKLGYNNESSIRSILNEEAVKRLGKGRETAEMLKEELKTKKMVDIGAGVERELGISATKLEEAVNMLENEGYHMYGVGVKTGAGKQTVIKVLADPDVEYSYAYNHTDEIQSIKEYSPDGGKTFTKLEYPSSLDGKRISIRYDEDGGSDQDGLIEIRRGVPDLSLGNSHYAQVRILVDGTHYLKGMAMYSDNMPPGMDIVFNTNKKVGTPPDKVYKAIKDDDPDNPFGAAITAQGQSKYIGKDGKEYLSPINKLKAEGEWDKMDKNLSSQFLSKQPMQLIKKQLDLTYKDKEGELADILALNNPTIKRKLLMDFANEADSATVHMKAAALPRQKTQVLIPAPFMKDTEVYAPNFNNGDKVALVRYPHGGLFEIPVLTVNNKNPQAKKVFSGFTDMVGINKKVADQLSGADFDGDQAVVIPITDRVRIASKKAFSGPFETLKNFDPKTQYSTEDKTGVTLMTKANTQKQMGLISNLITDMTLRKASDEEIVRAVKHSMVVIDAHKHKLDYKQSEKDNGIAALRNKYQRRIDDDGTEKVGGASTLLSRRKQTVEVLETQGSGIINPTTGKVEYKTSGRTYIDKKTGKVAPAMQKSQLLLETTDLRKLSSGTPQENAYADYGNKLKALANRARKEVLTTGKLEYKPQSAKTYKEEVSTLNAKLNVAAMNAPRERRAVAIANSVVKAKIQNNPDMDKKEIKKATSMALENARTAVGASGKNTRINITDREWEAIQAGAVTDSKLMSVLRYADDNSVRERATPRETKKLSTAKTNQIKSYIRSGYTYAEIADALNISTSTISKFMNPT
jgi:DNA invertase Pin-like site-specific DNA recombinase